MSYSIAAASNRLTQVAGAGGPRAMSCAATGRVRAQLIFFAFCVQS